MKTTKIPRTPGKPHAIQIEIGPDGAIASTVEGLAGPTCEGLLDFLDELGTVVEHRRTAAYYRGAARAARRVTTRE